MRVSDVISNVTKQNKTWTSWRQGTKLRVRLSLANARFASLLSKVMYIIKRKFKCLSWIWLLFHLMKWKKCIFHSCLRHSWNIHFFTSLDEIKVIFTPNIWISSISLWILDTCYPLAIFSSVPFLENQDFPVNQVPAQLNFKLQYMHNFWHALILVEFCSQLQSAEIKIHKIFSYFWQLNDKKIASSIIAISLRYYSLG